MSPFPLPPTTAVATARHGVILEDFLWLEREMPKTPVTVVGAFLTAEEGVDVAWQLPTHAVPTELLSVGAPRSSTTAKRP